MRALLALLLATLLAGCARGGEFEPAHFEHDFSTGEPRVRTFDVPAGIGQLSIALATTGLDDALTCEVRQPARIVVVDPTGREVVSIVADGAPIATGGNACTVQNAEPLHPARGGTWTVTFSGDGTLRGSADIAAG